VPQRGWSDLTCGGDVVEEGAEFKYLGMMMHGTEGLGLALQCNPHRD